ncbi:MAG: sigma-70 family RNA polymerase sigma factor [Anaerolineae bacterium]|nr:sigma-70 family RNA polymerase sigma factor [Anaerolineae bacterium]
MRHKSNEVLVERLLPHVNDDPDDRAIAWEEWYASVGAPSVLAFVRIQNDTSVPDADILQEAVVTAYEEVERGRYEPRLGIPFTAYVKGIARNKIREARRRTWRFTPIEETPAYLLESDTSHLERTVERREQLARLYDGILQLPVCRRQVLQGYLTGQSTLEIAEALGMTEETVRQHKSRALRSLRKLQYQ